MHKHPVEKLVSLHEEQLRPVFFETFLREKNVFETVGKVLSVLQLNASASNENTELFKKFWVSHFKAGGFSQFLKVVSGWIIESGWQTIPFIVIQTAYLAYLRTLTKFYNKILPKLEVEDSIVIKNTFPSIKFYFDQYSKLYTVHDPKLVFRSKILGQENKGLELIFQFFAVQHLFLGKFPTFNKVLAEKQTWDLGIFLIFCKQFAIFSQKKGEKKQQKEKLVQIFRKNSSGSMGFVQFLQAISEISQFYVQERRSINLKGFKLEDEKIYFFEMMKFADLSYLKRKMKPLKPPFAANEGHHRKVSDGYRFLVSEKVGKRLKVFRESEKRILVNGNGRGERNENYKAITRAPSTVRIRSKVRVYSEKCFKALKN